MKKNDEIDFKRDKPQSSTTADSLIHGPESPEIFETAKITNPIETGLVPYKLSIQEVNAKKWAQNLLMLVCYFHIWFSVPITAKSNACISYKTLSKIYTTVTTI